MTCYTTIDSTTQRKQITPGLYVTIEEEVTLALHSGFVKTILSKKDDAKGIKVQIQSGQVGRVFEIPTPDKIKQDNFKFYNLFFHETVYLLRHRKTQALITFPVASSSPEARQAILTQDPQHAPVEIKPEWYWKAYPKHKLIHPLYENQQVAFIWIGNQRRLRFDQFKALEIDFKTRMP